MSCKGYKHTEEAKKRISEARKKRMEEQGLLNSPEARQKMSVIASRKVMSDETRHKMSIAHKGKRPKNWADAIEKSRVSENHPKGENVWNWKGDEVGYEGLHAWVKRKLGSPKQCSRCETITARKYEWASISGEYKRDLVDWIRLCTSCHRKMDYERDGTPSPWNKGKKVQCNTGRTHFPKGHVPANQYLEDRICPTCGKGFHPRLARIKYCSHQCYWKSMIKDKET